MLRSIRQWYGIQLQASDGPIGQVKDFYFDDQSWAMSQLVIKTGHRLTGKEVLLPSQHVASISYEESTVFVSLSQKAVEQFPGHQMALAGAPD